ncbi:hypothetical protein [Paenibacillus solani]|uniref:hypothetical protein n=1 Tax=Paenibacillus solani TaxID=1705565 RepID=UPI003D2B5F1A
MRTRGNPMKMIVLMMMAILLTLSPLPAFTPTAEAASIVIDGKTNDWEGIPALSTNSGTTKTLKAAHDDRNLYLLVEGSGLSTAMGSLWLNTDGSASTGYQAYGWKETGIEWLLENNFPCTAMGGTEVPGAGICLQLFLLPNSHAPHPFLKLHFRSRSLDSLQAAA